MYNKQHHLDTLRCASGAHVLGVMRIDEDGKLVREGNGAAA